MGKKIATKLRIFKKSDLSKSCLGSTITAFDRVNTAVQLVVVNTSKTGWVYATE